MKILRNRNGRHYPMWYWTSVRDRYMDRLPLIPKNPFFNPYLHWWLGSDSLDRGLHDHPWWTISIHLWGPRLAEYCLDRAAGGWLIIRYRMLPRIVIRSPKHAHAVVKSGPKPALTLFLTGPRVRRWGFWSRQESTGWQSVDDVRRDIAAGRTISAFTEAELGYLDDLRQGKVSAVRMGLVKGGM